MTAQYRLPDASDVLARKLRHLDETRTNYTLHQRREDSPWLLVTEGAS